MIFAHFLLDVNESNAFIVGCEDTREALLVDAATWDPRIPAYLKAHGLRLSAVFITHDHFDHTGGLVEALRYSGAVAYAGHSRAGGYRAQAVGQDSIIRFGNIEGRVATTPGHTPESISLILPGMVFTGDALFSGSVGGTSSAQLHRQEIEGIREHLFCLPDDYQVHPGHGPSSTIGIERRYNPFFVAAK